MHEAHICMSQHVMCSLIYTVVVSHTINFLKFVIINENYSFEIHFWQCLRRSEYIIASEKVLEKIFLLAMQVSSLSH